MSHRLSTKQITLILLVIVVAAFVGITVGYFVFVPKKSEVEKGYMFVGSKESNIYHYPSCEWAKKIASRNLVYFKDAADARAKGYRPCLVCKPP